MDGTSLFGSRCVAGEFLFYELGRLRDPLVFGLTVGAMEVAYPIAYLGCGQLRYLPRKIEAGELRARRPVVLADDGLTPLPDLLGGVQRLAAAGVESLVLAAPWLPRSLHRDLPSEPEIRVDTLYPRALSVVPLYDASDRPSGERVAWFLDAVRDHVHRDLVRALASHP